MKKALLIFNINASGETATFTRRLGLRIVPFPGMEIADIGAASTEVDFVVSKVVLRGGSKLELVGFGNWPNRSIREVEAILGGKWVTKSQHEDVVLHAAAGPSSGDRRLLVDGKGD